MRVTIYLINFKYMQDQSYPAAPNKIADAFTLSWERTLNPIASNHHPIVLFLKQVVPVCVCGGEKWGKAFVIFLPSFFFSFASRAFFSITFLGFTWSLQNSYLGAFRHCESKGEKNIFQYTKKFTQSHHWIYLIATHKDQRCFFFKLTILCAIYILSSKKLRTSIIKA